MNPESNLLASAYRVGRLLNQLTFHSQQAWFFHIAHFRKAEDVARLLATKARDLVPVTSRDAFQRDLKRKMEPWLAEMIRQGRCEDLLEDEERLRFSYDPTELISYRAEYLTPVFAILQHIREMLTSRLGDAARLALRLGEVVDQALHPEDVYRFMEESNSQSGPDLSLHGAPVESGEITPGRGWVEEVRQLLGELGILGAVPARVLESAETVEGKNVSEVYNSLDLHLNVFFSMRRTDTLSSQPSDGIVETRINPAPPPPSALEGGAQPEPSSTMQTSQVSDLAATEQATSVLAGRLGFDRCTRTIVLDGIPYANLDVRAFRLFKGVAEATDRDERVTSKGLKEQKLGDYLRENLPAELAALLDARGGRSGGFCLVLPPMKSQFAGNPTVISRQ